MVIIHIDLFEPMNITKERISEMITWQPRRMKLAKEWPDILHPPAAEGNDSFLKIPFGETLINVFNYTCRGDLKGFDKSGDRPYSYLADNTETTLVKVSNLIEIIGSYVTIRDCLALSFALDYDRTDGDPSKSPTTIGNLRRIAKKYDESKPTAATYAAADKLVEPCLDFIDKIVCYKLADVVIAMPPSRPDKPFDLPSYLASKIAENCGMINLSDKVCTVKARPRIKDVSLSKKLASLEGTIDVCSDSFKGKKVLVIDDLYQSGVSINYVGMLLLEAGAEKVFGLACEKTCSNDDNISRR